MVKALLWDHKDLVLPLAQYAVDHRHCYGDDCERVLKAHHRLFRTQTPAILCPDWQIQVKAALDVQAKKIAAARVQKG
jgi:hypothetical protein